nr:hypothetical protein GCM10020092_104780 [Actinoplanes digitatis]
MRREPTRPGRTTSWPGWAAPALVSAYEGLGITAPWEHQAAAAELAHEGQHVVLATGTASGKSMAYQMPGLTKLLIDPRATVLYLSPTKALAADQSRALSRLGLDGVRLGHIRR